MSFASPQQSQSAEAVRFNTAQGSTLANISLPEISSTLNAAFADLNSAKGSGIPDSVRKQYDPIIAATDRDYAAAGRGQSAYIRQEAKQSGNIYGGNAVSDTILAAGNTLEQSRRGAQQNLAYDEAAAGLTQYNQLLDLMGAGGQTALGLGGGFMGLSGAANSLLPNQSQGGAALSGAISGASLGTTISPGWGTLIGGVVGAGAGALTYGG